MRRSLSLALPVAALMLTPACAQDQIDTTNREAIEEIVRSYILENPEIIEEALIELSNRERVAEAERARENVAANQDALFNNSADFSVGPADAPVTIVEFFDYRCGFCKRSADWAVGLPEQFDNQVRIIFKEYPILSPESEKAALAAIAAGKQGKYVEMHMALMELDNGSGFGDDQIDTLADEIGIDVAKMRADMKSIDVQAAVADSKALAQTIGISGTPNF
ncbi:MAG: thioredoxin domain-containing protein, partial [Pseudomonadota bacterium]